MRALTVALIVLPSLALAQSNPLRELMNARTLGGGGAYRALGLSADAAIGNPATLSTFQRYQIELGGAWDFGPHFRNLSFSAVDSKTGAVAAGLDYHYLSFEGEEGRKGAHAATLALAFPIVSKVHIGASGRYFNVPGESKISAGSMDVGLVIKPMDSLQLGAVGHNLIGTGHAILGRYYSFAAGFITGSLTAAVDVRADWEQEPEAAYVTNLGAEYVFSAGIPLRAGYTHDSSNGGHYVSFGSGIWGQGGGLDIGYRHETNGPGRLLGLTLRIQN